MKQIINKTFYCLLVVYIVLILLISFKVISKYTLHFEIFSFLLAAFSIFIAKKQKIEINEKLIFIPLIIVILSRFIPYLTNSIPLGYDVGIYKYAIESFPNLIDKWSLGTFPPLFLILTSLINKLTTINFTLTLFLIILEVILSLVLYITVKSYFNKESAFFAIIFFSLSVIQFKLFSYLYFKNLIALILLLLSFYLLQKNKRILFIISCVSIAGIHRPTFLIFALSYFILFLISKNKLKNIINGVFIIVLSIPIYLDNFKELLLDYVQPLIQANIGAGTFVNFFQYQFLSLVYLPFALIGFIHLIKRRKFNILLISSFITSIIVYFQIIFFNRFIIHLDLFLIIFAGYGLLIVVQNKKLVGILITALLLISGLIIIINQSIISGPLIDEEELKIIESLQSVEENSFIMATSSYYSPWLLGYSKRRVIAPGLFDYNMWDVKKWNEFWNTTDTDRAVNILHDYEKPLYVFIGKNQLFRPVYESPCFEKIINTRHTYVYKLKC